MSGSNRSRWRLLRRFLLSYLIVFAIPVALSARIYYLSVRSARDHAIARIAVDLDRAIDLIDDRLQEATATTAILAENRAVTALYTLPSELSGSPDVYKIYAASQYLSSPYLYTGPVSEFFIFYRENDIALSRTGTSVNPRFYYGDSFAHGSGSYNDWMSYLFGRYHSATILSGDSIAVDGIPIAGILVLQSIPIGFPYRAKAVIGSAIESRELVSILDGIITGSDGFVAAYSSDGTMAAFSGAVPAPIDWDFTQSGRRSVTVDGRDLMLSWITSPRSGWRLAAGVPLSQVHYDSDQARNTVFVVLIISVVCAAVFAYRFSYRRAEPIAHTLSLVSSFLRLSGQTHNELDLMEEGVERLFHEHRNLLVTNTDLRQQMRRQHELLKDSFVERLTVEGFAREEEAVEFAYEAGVSAYAHKFLAGIVHLCGFSSEIDVAETIEIDSAKTLARSALEDTFGDAILLHATRRGFSAVFLLPSGEHEDYDPWIHSRFTRSAETLLSDHGVRIFCVTGTVEERLIDVCRSWSGAEGLFDLCCPNGPAFHRSAATTSAQFPATTFPLRVEEQLIHTVRSGNVDAASAIIDRILSLLGKQGSYTPQAVRLLTHELLGTAMRLMPSGDDADHGTHHAADLAARIESHTDSASRLTLVVDAIIDIAREYEQHIRTGNEETKDLLLEFTDEHLGNSNLQLSDLSTVVPYSANYLYRFFRDHVGMTFANYLEERRMAHATELMQGDMLIQEIAEECGYNSCHAFRRAFKRVKGVLPTEYRATQEADRLA